MWFQDDNPLSSTDGHMSTASQFYALYRKSSIGLALVDSLDDLISAGHITPQLALRIMAQFDKSVATVFASTLKARCSTKGHLKVYRLCDEVWTFVLQNATFKVEGDTIGPFEKVKIVACKGTPPTEKEVKKEKHES